MPGRDQRNRKQQPITISAVNPWRTAFWEELFAVLRSRGPAAKPRDAPRARIIPVHLANILSEYSA